MKDLVERSSVVQDLAARAVQQRALVPLLAAAFLVLLDTSIVINALPAIGHSLGASTVQVQFVLAGYALAYGVLLITGGRLGDLYGRKRLFLLGLGAFVLSSLACGLAGSAAALVVFRVVQGMSSALLFPQVAGLIQALFPPLERARPFGLLGATIGLGTATGPLLGGLLLGADLGALGWRPLFFINVPLGLLALWAGWRSLPDPHTRAGRLDLPGAGLLGLGLLGLTYPLVVGGDQGWPAWTLLAMLAGTGVLGGFWLHQRQLKARGGAPLLDLGLFADRGFAVGAVITPVLYSAVSSFFVLMALYLQDHLRLSPLEGALTLLPIQVCSFIASLLSARLSALLGRNLLSLGAALLTLGLAGLMAVFHFRPGPPGELELLPALMVFGVGFGFVVAPLLNAILMRVRPESAGAASGTLSTTQQIGAALGVALTGALYFGQLAHGVPAPVALVQTLCFHLVAYALTFALVLALPTRAPVPARP